MGQEIEYQDRISWQAGFQDGLAGRRSPRGNKLAYRSGYLAGSTRRISGRTMMAVALATVAIPMTVAVVEASPEADPVFAAIEQHRQAWQALANAPDDEQGRLHEAVLAAEAQIVDTRPRTAAGVVALRGYHRELRRRYYYAPPLPDPYWGSGKG